MQPASGLDHVQHQPHGRLPGQSDALDRRELRHIEAAGDGRLLPEAYLEVVPGGLEQRERDLGDTGLVEAAEEHVIFVEHAHRLVGPAAAFTANGDGGEGIHLCGLDGNGACTRRGLSNGLRTAFLGVKNHRHREKGLQQQATTVPTTVNHITMP